MICWEGKSRISHSSVLTRVKHIYVSDLCSMSHTTHRHTHIHTQTCTGPSLFWAASVWSDKRIRRSIPLTSQWGLTILRISVWQCLCVIEAIRKNYPKLFFLLLFYVCINSDCAVFRLNERNDEILITRYRHHPKRGHKRCLKKTADHQNTLATFSLLNMTLLQFLFLHVFSLHQHEKSCCKVTTERHPV